MVVIAMKLISVPADPTIRGSLPAGSDGVMSALRRAASETGTDFNYLLSTAMRESSLNPTAKAPTSSATGLFQFIEQTWLGTMKAHGAEHGLKTYADAIEVGNDGRYRVADGAMRQEILSLRKDPATAALMAGEMTSDTRGDMEDALGRGVSAGELYVAHFLGPKAAIKMIKAAEATPGASAADMFPQAASANRSIFFDRGGNDRSLSTVLGSLKAKHEDVGEIAPVTDAMLIAQTTRDAPVTSAEIAEIAKVEPAAATSLRGAVNDTATTTFAKTTPPASSTGQNTWMMSPVMVQLLASLDPMPHMAASLLGDEPKLRRAELELI